MCDNGLCVWKNLSLRHELFHANILRDWAEWMHCHIGPGCQQHADRKIRDRVKRSAVHLSLAVGCSRLGAERHINKLFTVRRRPFRRTHLLWRRVVWHTNTNGLRCVFGDAGLSERFRESGKGVLCAY